MHRVDSTGYVTESGKRLFINRNLPSVPGTTVGAEWKNAVQEEIAQLIEYAGLTLSASAAADKTAGWDQLKTAIFESAAIDTAAIKNDAITNAKIDGVSLSKLEDGITDITKVYSTVEHILNIDPTEFKITRQPIGGSVYDTHFAQHTYQGLFAKKTSDTVASTDINRIWLWFDKLEFWKKSIGSYEILFDCDYTYSTIRIDYDTGSYKYSRMGHSTGFRVNDYDVSSGYTKYMTINENGLTYDNDGWRIKHKVINESSSGWSGSGPYTKTIDLDIGYGGNIYPVIWKFTYKGGPGGTRLYDSLMVPKDSATKWEAELSLNDDPATLGTLKIFLIYRN